MDFNDDNLYVDELARRIEKRIREIDNKRIEESKNNQEEFMGERSKNKINDLDLIIEELDKKIKELDEENICEFDVNLLMDKINSKLRVEEQKREEIYNLKEITEAVDEIIKDFEEKRRRKKEKKAMYCDLARKKAFKGRVDSNKSSS